MSDLDQRLAQLLQDAVPQPPRQLDATTMRDRRPRRPHRVRATAAALAAAAAVAAVSVIAVLIGSGPGKHRTSEMVTPHRCGAVAVARSTPIGAPGTIALFPDCAGWVSGLGGIGVLHTADEGAHWSQVAPRLAPGEHPLSTSAISAGRARMLTETEHLNPSQPTELLGVSYAVWRTDDAGATWARTDLGELPSADVSMAFADPQHGIAAFTKLFDSTGSGRWQATVLTTSDGGAHWTHAATTPFGGSVRLSQSGRAFMVDRGGTGLYASIDAARTWTPVTLPFQPDTLAGPQFTDARNGIYGTATRGGLSIAVTNDGGATWHAAPRKPPSASGGPGVLQAVTSTDWVLTANNTVTWTHDAGHSWSAPAHMNGPSVDAIEQLDFISTKIGWARAFISPANYRQKPCSRPCPTNSTQPTIDLLLETSDGGRTWTQVTTPSK